MKFGSVPSVVEMPGRLLFLAVFIFAALAYWLAVKIFKALYKT